MAKYEENKFDPPAPVAETTLRDPTSGKTLSGVLLLVDSGSDITLLPRSAVEKLGISADGGVDFEFFGIEGTLQTAPGAHLDVLFLGRAYRGRYALIDLDVGILGRDVINHLALVLHGPSREWFVYPSPTTKS